MNHEYKIPTHVGIIMDGNGRWATERGLKRSAGHAEGYKTLKKLAVHILNKGVKIITCILLAFMIFDVTISCMAGIRQNERRKNIPPDNKLESFIDKKYPDEYMDKVYINKKEV